MRELGQFLALVFAMAVLSVLAGCAREDNAGTPDAQIDDDLVTGKVKTAIFHAAGLRAREITVVSVRGHVRLGGVVGARADADRAVRAAQGVAGVKVVTDDTRVRTGVR